jgi:hypothetical protein
VLFSLQFGSGCAKLHYLNVRPDRWSATGQAIFPRSKWPSPFRILQAAEKGGVEMPEIFSAVKIADEIVCRDCLTMEEMVSAQRGITDSLSADEVKATKYTCSRCGNEIEPFEIKF